MTAMDELLSGSGGEGSAGVGGRREGGAGGLNDYYSDGTGSVDDDAALASVAGLFAGASAGVGGEAQQASMQSKRSALHVIRQQNRCVVCGGVACVCLPPSPAFSHGVRVCMCGKQESPVRPRWRLGQRWRPLAHATCFQTITTVICGVQVHLQHCDH